MNLQAVRTFHATRIGHLIFALVELSLGIAFADVAFDTGDLWQWLLAFVGLFGFLQNAGRVIVGEKK